jgi:hypothetical protein
MLASVVDVIVTTLSVHVTCAQLKLSSQLYLPHRDCSTMQSTYLCANFIWLNNPYVHIRSAITLHIGHNVHALSIFV